LKYHVEYDPGLKNDLKKLDKQIRLIIKKWIDENLEGCEDPRRTGKALAGVHKGIFIIFLENFS